MSGNVFTASVLPPGAVSYQAGVTFRGKVSIVQPDLRTSTIPVTYTVQSAVTYNEQNSITLTASISNAQANGLIPLSGDVTFTTGDLPTLSYYEPSRLLLITSLDGSSPTGEADPNNGAVSPSSSPLPTTTSSANPTTSPATNTAAASSSITKGATTGNQPARGHSTGELAGLAVGLLIAGALIAGLVVFLVMRRKAKQRSRMYHPAHEQLSHKEISSTAIIGDGKTWQRHLPQAEPDHAISRPVVQLLDQIELHVEKFYSERTVNNEDVGSDRTLQPLSDALALGLRPTSAIKKVLMTIILSTIDFDRKSDCALLPATFNTARMESDHKKPDIERTIAEWRTLTAYLGANALQSEPYLSDRERRISALSSQLLRGCQPWLRGDEGDCKQSTNAILRRGSDLGVLLFSQPASFTWSWGENSAPAGRRRTILPGLRRVTDEHARPLATPVVLVEPRLDA